MKNGKTLMEFAQEIDRRSHAIKDYLLDTRKLSLDYNNENYELSIVGDGLTRVVGVNDVAHRQIGTNLGIPAKYAEKMRTEYPELLTTNVNGWFSKTPQTRMLRTLDETARAFLSERYRRIDNLQIASTVLPIISEMEDARIESCELTDYRMYIKVVNPRLECEVVPGDVVQSGILITNSEVGMGSVNVQPLVYRLVCTNGMIVNDAATRRYHIGRGNEAGENYELYSNETLQADDRALMMKISDTVRAAVDETRFSRVVAMMRDARDAKITTTDIPKVVELASSDFGMTAAEGKTVLNHLIMGNEFSLYGLSNAVTRAAQDMESYDRSTDLENIGYNILGMSRSQWNRLNATVA